MPPNPKSKKKSGKSITPITKCFAASKVITTSKEDSVTSPEYKMSRNTRNSNRSQQDEKDQQVQSNSEYSDSSDEEEGINNQDFIHSGVLPCPELIDKGVFKGLSHENQMDDKIISFLNGICEKVTEMDVVINHDTDGIITRLQMAQKQLDDNTTSVNQVEKDIEST